MRPEIGLAPHAMHKVLADAELTGKFAAGPMRRPVARLAAGGLEDARAQLGRELRGRFPRTVGVQSVDPVRQKATLPLRDGRTGGVQLVGDGAI